MGTSCPRPSDPPPWGSRRASPPPGLLPRSWSFRGLCQLSSPSPLMKGCRSCQTPLPPLFLLLLRCPCLSFHPNLYLPHAGPQNLVFEEVTLPYLLDHNVLPPAPLPQTLIDRLVQGRVERLPQCLYPLDTLRFESGVQVLPNHLHTLRQWRFRLCRV